MCPREELKYPICDSDIKEICPDKLLQQCSENRLVVFRVTSKPPIQEDFSPFAYQKPHMFKKAGKKTRCKAFGISVFTRKEEAFLAQQSQINSGLKFIYQGLIIQKRDGKVFKTPSRGNPPQNPPKPSHKTWYPYKEVNETEIFTQLVKYPITKSKNGVED